MITRDKTIEETIPKYFNEKKYDLQNTMFLYFACLFFITIALLIAISIYCSLIKHRAEKKHLLPFNVTNNESGEVLH